VSLIRSNEYTRASWRCDEPP